MTSTEPAPTTPAETVQARRLTSGLTVLVTLPNRDEPYPLQVDTVARVGVAFGQQGPDALPVVQIRFRNMPRPWKGTMDVRGDKLFMVVAG